MKKAALILVLGMTGALWGASAVHAVTVGPVRLDFFVNPGDTASGTIMVQNEQNQAETFYPSFQKFTENNGVKSFTNDPSDLPGWFTLPSSVTLKAGEQKTIPFTVTVPKNAAPGGHFAVMWWGTAPSTAADGQQVSVVTRAGILIYMTVAGDIHEGMTVTDFSANGGGSFFFGYPINFSSSLFNEGNVYETPTGTVAVYNTLGMLSTQLPINPNGSSVLPQSTKQFSAMWASNPWAFGVYHAVLTVSYGQNSQTITASKWFFVLPLWTTLGVIIVLILIFWVLPGGVKRYNRWIVKEASKSHGS